MTSEQLQAKVAELEEENARLSDGAVCGDCDGSGWLENRVEGRYPCTCMTEAEPYQLLAEQLAAEQLNNKLMREALEHCMADGDFDTDDARTSFKEGMKALATPNLNRST